MSSTFPPERFPGQTSPGNRLPPTMPETPPPVYNGRYELNRQIARGGGNDHLKLPRLDHRNSPPLSGRGRARRRVRQSR
jgi:hypothetical protein